MKTFEDVIRILDLVPLPEEGGFYRETFRSTRMVNSDELGVKSECTAIYYLITEFSFSALHAVDQDEIFHFYAGSPVEMLQIVNGESKKIILSGNIFEGHHPQVIVPKNIWQGTKLLNPAKDDWALLGCTVSPGFELQNFHIKPRSELQKMFPNIKDDIAEFSND